MSYKEPRVLTERTEGRMAKNLTVAKYSLHPRQAKFWSGLLVRFYVKYRFPEKGHVTLSRTCFHIVVKIILGTDGDPRGLLCCLA